MQKINDQELLKMGEKYQKWLENTTVNRAAYKINNNLYYLAMYSNKFSSKNKAHAVISKSSNKEEALQSILPHFSYAISSNNLIDGAYERTKIDFSLWTDIRDYIDDVIENNTLTEIDEPIYKRASETMTTVIEMQKEIKNLWKKMESYEDFIKERGYFTDEDVEKFSKAVIDTNMFQFKQTKPQYDYCEDFDVIYKKRNKYRSYGKLFNVDFLKGMTSRAAKHDLEVSLKDLSLGQDIDNFNETELHDRWLKNYKEGLKLRASREKKTLRYP